MSDAEQMPQQIKVVAPDPLFYRLHVRKRRRGRQTREEIIDARTPAEFAAKTAHLGDLLVGYELATVHECCACGKRDAWRPDWSWYGSVRQLDADQQVKKFCSLECRGLAVERGIVPANAPTLAD